MRRTINILLLECNILKCAEMSHFETFVSQFTHFYSGWFIYIHIYILHILAHNYYNQRDIRKEKKLWTKNEPKKEEILCPTFIFNEDILSI